MALPSHESMYVRKTKHTHQRHTAKVGCKYSAIIEMTEYVKVCQSYRIEGGTLWHGGK